MATSSSNGVGPFCPDLESWSTFQDRFELFFVAKGFDKSKQVAFLLTEIGREVYGTLENLLSPVKPKAKTYKELTEALAKHYSTQTVVIAERFRFHKRVQKHGESVTKFVEALRQLAKTCEFGGFLEDALRDQLVCGLLDEKQQASLLAIRDLTLAKALEDVQAMEIAASQASAIKAETGSSVHAIGQKRSTSTQNKSARKDSKGEKCYRCGGEHAPAGCRFRTEKCRMCDKVGHIARMCRTNSSGKVKQVDVAAVRGETVRVKPMMVEMTLDGVSTSMEVDTGAAVTLMSETAFRTVFPSMEIQKTAEVLTTYTKARIDVVGKVWVTVEYEGRTYTEMPVLIVRGEGDTLLGRNWLSVIRLNWPRINPVRAVNASRDVDELLDKHKALFDEGVGELKGVKATLHLQEGFQPVFKRPRSVPYATSVAIERELDRLVEQGIATHVTHSEWATPVVPVVKSDGSVRLCGDYKVTVNPGLKVDQHPLPKPDDLFASLNGGQQFSKLDLSHAYQQLLLDPESQHVVTIVTHRGLYRLSRLPYGIASAPAIFQSVMEKILIGIEGVSVYLDDILITAPDRETHIARLTTVLERLEEAGLRLKKKKCVFLQDSVEYLGFMVDATGLHATPSKIEAIVDAPAPTNVSQLRSFMGLVNYYGRFIQDLATVAHPLHRLMRAAEPWRWTAEEQQAFKTLKDKLTAPQVLVHYNPELPVQLACDASPHGVGAVLAHVFPDGSERPIAFASRSLSASEVNYHQLDREALGIVFGVTKFHMYLYGRKFTLVTDNKPLASIIGPKKGIPPIAAMRLQRWAVILAAYDYTVQVKTSEQNANADCMSRLPLPNAVEVNLVEEEVASILQTVLHNLPIAASDVATATESDTLLTSVKSYISASWPTKVSDELQAFKNVATELCVTNGCLFRGERVVIPSVLRSRILQELHVAHAGIVRMKSLARAHVWWPGIDADIERESKKCDSCQIHGKEESKAPLCPWPWPQAPWKRIHIDFAGPYEGKMHLVVVDAHSKWIEVESMSVATSSTTIKALRRWFAQFGYPDVLVSDNGPQFTSEEFEVFLKRNGITHMKSAPYFPATNGAAERCVQTFKKAMAPEKREGRDLEATLQDFLMQYRATPHATTAKSPAKLFLGRDLRTRLAQLTDGIPTAIEPEMSEVAERVEKKQEKQKTNYDKRTKQTQFVAGDRVYVRVYGKQQRWTAGIIESSVGSLSCAVKLRNGTAVRRHFSQMKMRISDDHRVEVDCPEPASPQKRRSKRTRRPPSRYDHE